MPDTPAESDPSLSDSTSSPAPDHDPYVALRHPNYRRYWIGNLIAMLGMQMQKVAVLWEIYHRTGSPLQLAYVSLIQFLPVLVLAIPAGQLADRFDRRRIVLLAMSMLTCGSLGLAAISLFQLDLWLMYACLLMNGIARALQQPAKTSLVPQLVPLKHFSNAVTWSGSGFQLACIAGPTLGGLLIAAWERPALIYLIEAISTLTFFCLMLTIRPRPQVHEAEALSWRAAGAGLAFVWKNKIILGALTLDLFAVLFGGATTLLPVYANDILKVGATGLGWLWAAPAIGAIATSIAMTHLPPMERAGRTLLWSVAGFGVAMIVFGFSRSFPLSFLMLVLTGAFDMVSVVVRHTLVQLQTPDEMRGRVSAVKGIFIGASNELGGFESGAAAAFFATFAPRDPHFGPTMSVVTGGLGTIAVVLLAAWWWPTLRRYGRLDEDQILPSQLPEPSPENQGTPEASGEIVGADGPHTRPAPVLSTRDVAIRKEAARTGALTQE